MHFKSKRLHFCLFQTQNECMNKWIRLNQMRSANELNENLREKLSSIWFKQFTYACMSMRFHLIYVFQFCQFISKFLRSTIVFAEYQLLPYSCWPASTVAVVVRLDCHLHCCQQQSTYFGLVTDNPFSVIYFWPRLIRRFKSKNRQLRTEYYFRIMWTTNFWCDASWIYHLIYT